MTTETWLVSVAGALLGMISMRTTTILMRGQMEPKNSGIALETLNAMIFVVFLALLVFQFVRGEWWHPLVTFVGVGLGAGAIVSRSSLPLFISGRHAVNVLCLAAAIGCWFLPDW